MSGSPHYRLLQVGGGPETDLHLRAWVEHPRVAEVYLAEKSRARREELSARWGIIKRAAASARELLADGAVDLVHVALPAAQAPSAVREALAAGKHVLCSGPGAATLAEFDALLAAARAADRRLLPAVPSLLNPAVIRAVEVLRAGEIGAVRLAQVTSLRPPDQWGDDLALELGYEALCVLQALAGPARAVLAAASAAGLVATLQLPGPVLGSLTLGPSPGARPVEERRIFGEQGQALIRDDPEDELPLVLLHDSDLLPVRLPIPLQMRPWYVARMLGHLVDCVAEGREPQVTTAQARQGLATALALQESARGGSRVAVTQ